MRSNVNIYPELVPIITHAEIVCHCEVNILDFRPEERTIFLQPIRNNAGPNFEFVSKFKTALLERLYNSNLEDAFLVEVKVENHINKIRMIRSKA